MRELILAITEPTVDSVIRKKLNALGEVVSKSGKVDESRLHTNSNSPLVIHCTGDTSKGALSILQANHLEHLRKRYRATVVVFRGDHTFRYKEVRA